MLTLRQKLRVRNSRTLVKTFTRALQSLSTMHLRMPSFHWCQNILHYVEHYLTTLQENISSVILTGGSSRTPMVQAAVKAAVGE